MRALVSALRLNLQGRFHRDRGLVAPLFDAAWYRAAYPDVAAHGYDPLAHFLVRGWRERRNPNAGFSTTAYMAKHPQAAASGVNPFVHFLRNPSRTAPPAQSPGFRHAALLAEIPMETRIWAASQPVATRPAADLASALARSRSGLARLHLTFSHDDYSANLGGVQLALAREAAGVERQGRDHLHLFPARAWQVVRTAGEPGQLGVVWNGEHVGVFEPAAVIEALAASAKGEASGRSFAIHSLLGHSADETVEILAAVGLRRGWFWLHDFASICAGFHLLRNDVEDCAAPPPESAACSICLYGPWRWRHISEHDRLFRRLDLTLLSPSQSALDFWRAAWDHPVREARVHPHAWLEERGPAPVPHGDRPFRVAYPGLPTAHKGWGVFQELMARFDGDGRYEFVHLGARPGPEPSVRFREAAGGMAAALRAETPDAVLIWPLCRETFSFVAYEAVSAGCAVITGPDSGNVAAFVESGGHGVVLPGEAALAASFESGEILALARSRRRPRLYELRASALTADLLTEAVGA